MLSFYEFDTSRTFIRERKTLIPSSRTFIPERDALTVHSKSNIASECVYRKKGVCVLITENPFSNKFTASQYLKITGERILAKETHRE